MKVGVHSDGPNFFITIDSSPSGVSAVPFSDAAKYLVDKRLHGVQHFERVLLESQV